MGVISETKLVQAFRTLFGSQVDVNRDFLSYVQPSGVKSAYRRKARENHPDLFATQPAHVQERQTAQLRNIIEAYDVLNKFLTQRETGRWNPERTSRQSKAQTPGTVRKTASRSAKRSSETRGSGRYYAGALPPRTLLFGKYLFYRGKITYGILIDAVLWQRRQRPAASCIALQWGLLDQAGAARINRLCRDPRRFGETAVELGLLTPDQVKAIVEYKRSIGHKLGEYFVQKKIFTREELDAFVREHGEHNAAVLAAASRNRPRANNASSSRAADGI